MGDGDTQAPPEHREELILELDGSWTLDVYRPGSHSRFTNVNSMALAAAIEGLTACRAGLEQAAKGDGPAAQLSRDILDHDG